MRTYNQARPPVIGKEHSCMRHQFLFDLSHNGLFKLLCLLRCPHVNIYYDSSTPLLPFSFHLLPLPATEAFSPFIPIFLLHLATSFILPFFFLSILTFFFWTNQSQILPSVLLKQLEIISQLLHSLGSTVWEIRIQPLQDILETLLPALPWSVCGRS